MARVRDLMRRDFIQVSPEEDRAAVLRLMAMARVRALPVVADGRLAGMVSHRDLAEAALEHARSGEGLAAGPIAPFVRATEPVSIEATLDEAARRMIGEQTPCLAATVPSDGAGRVVGLLTEGDLLRAAYRSRPSPGRA